MEYFSAVLNLPWTLLGIMAGAISGPRKITLHHKPRALVISVQNFWWLEHLPGHKGVRAATLGSVVLIGPKRLKGDVEHELVHVEQYGERHSFNRFYTLMSHCDMVIARINTKLRLTKELGTPILQNARIKKLS